MKQLKLSRILIAAAAFLLAAAVSCRKEDEPIPVLTFKSTMVSYEGGTQSVKVAAQKDWRLEVNYNSSETGWISFTQTSGTGIVGIFLTVKPNDSDDSREADIILITPQHRVTTHLVQGSKTTSKAPGWLELPALDQPKLGFFTHSMDGGKYINKATSGVRNWSFYYDYDAFVSWWVAYPLNSGLLKGSVGRSDWQASDPLLPASAVCNLSGGSYGGGWTRGHQIPSADRQLSAGANASTFYPTNLTPQDYNFNGGDNYSGIWVRLEGQVRTYAGRCDTLYVVTGCDVRNSTALSGNNGGHRAKIPTHYYKALLRKKGSSYSAIAFHIPHSGSDSVCLADIMDYVCSIDELEERTGVDFFVNLANYVGKETAASIEAADPAVTVQNW
ncbi:MAG: DNA/RNA non-specific endonuclease [Bacteroidales bacterium]|nr:DNA/RNA non-specific endonuclease [Bacteroidales bacterium]